MNGKEALALVGIAAVSAGAVQAGLQYDTMASARAQAITAEACGEAYDAPESHNNDAPHESPLGSPMDFATLADWHGPEAGDQPSQEVGESTSALSLDAGHYMVTQKTIECLEEGWVQGGESVDTSSIVVGESETLLRAFVKLEESRGEHFDPSSTILWGLGGAVIGVFYMAGQEKREERNQREARSEEEDAFVEEVRRRGIYDYENDSDGGPAAA